jgi:hypothetical protein
MHQLGVLNKMSKKWIFFISSMIILLFGCFNRFFIGTFIPINLLVSIIAGGIAGRLLSISLKLW